MCSQPNWNIITHIRNVYIVLWHETVKLKSITNALYRGEAHEDERVEGRVYRLNLKPQRILSPSSSSVCL